MIYRSPQSYSERTVQTAFWDTSCMKCIEIIDLFSCSHCARKVSAEAQGCG
jgi:hypothetical protein